jgi:ABC-type multidrug transport system ATPase subunit
MNMGVVSDTNVLFDALTPLNHIELFSALKGKACVDAEKLLEDLGFTPGCDQLPANFATASEDVPQVDKRILCLAIAIVTGPQLLLLDEPFTGLETSQTTKVMSKIKALQEKGTTVIYTTRS